MKLGELHDKLILAARADAPDCGVPYAFEKRIMAGLASKQVEDLWTLWGAGLWRGAFASLLLSVGLSIWALQANGEQAQDLEATMFSAAEQLVDSWPDY
ncbi:MAG: hypothetical protein L0Y58_06645 [Verrucomicrobia subdivision 3 bacterium]|nr:hypothetical protein [Limisphaerales bacterium]